MKLNFKTLFYSICGAVLITVVTGLISYLRTGNANPFFSENSYNIVLAESLPEGGRSEIEIIKDRPEVRFKKWNGEVNMGVSYPKVNASASKETGSEKVIWKDNKNTAEEVHAYPINPPAGGKAGLQDGGFEIEVVLNEKPNTNKFDFRITGAEDLDFLYQPPLNEEYPNRGCSATECKFANHTTSRAENVVGSYAVYHKTKKDHILGETNYGTGKAYHIFRPKAIDANGKEQWAILNYENGILSVTVPQQFLDSVTYPVIVDPTFGYTTLGGTIDCGDTTITYYLQLNDLSPAGSNTMTNITIGEGTCASGTGKFGLYTESADAPNARQVVDASAFTITVNSFNTNTVAYSYALAASTQYWVSQESVTGNIGVRWDTGGTKDIEYEAANSPATASSAGEISTTARPSAYVTYTSAFSHVNIRGGGSATNSNVKIRGGSSGGSGGPVAFDASMTGGNSSDGDSQQGNGVVSISSTGMTVGASATCLVATIVTYVNGGASTNMTMTWNSVSMTPQASVNNGNNTAYIFVLPNPATGNKTLAASWTSSADVYMSAVSFTGTDTATCVNASDNTTSITASVTVPSDANGASVAASIKDSGDPTMNQTAFWANSPFSPGGGGSYAIGGTSNQHTFTYGGGTTQANAGVHVIAGSGGAGGNVKFR